MMTDTSPVCSQGKHGLELRLLVMWRCGTIPRPPQAAQVVLTFVRIVLILLIALVVCFCFRTNYLISMTCFASSTSDVCMITPLARNSLILLKSGAIVKGLNEDSLRS